MNEKALKTLEFNKIIDMLASLAGSSMGKDLCRKLKPSNDIDEIRIRQEETSDALSRVYKRGTCSFRGVYDIRPSLKRLEIGASLSAKELLQLASVLETSLRVRSYGISAENEEDLGEDSLSHYFSSLEPLSFIRKEITRCIIGENDFADDASPALKNIRRSINNTHNKIQEQLNKIMTAASNKNILQDNLITMRGGRYCLPVKQEYRSHLPGMIHDQSSTGSTVFIEPMAIVKLNNEIKELTLKEQEEIERILANLSNMVAEYTDTIATNLRTLVELDYIFAKANLAKTMNGSQPEFNEDRIIDIKKARHPLIDPKEVVPIDISLGQDFNMLIITGPNTGGKTVSLKTVGLFTLMGQAGLHIPALHGSRLGVFDEVYADIGDEQSIEQSLSTFSSHMTNIVSILKNANYKSLVLFDELGAGTDPTEGAALAMSILDSCHNKDIRTMATTHYSELKVYALSTPRVSNAACEFDITTLRPTYRLLIGIPGKSNAFAISKRLGLPDDIINNAQDKLDAEDKSFEDLLTDLENKRIAIEKAEKEIEEHKNETKRLRASLESKYKEIENSKKRIIENAKEEARILLQEAKDYADEAIKKYNKWSSSSGFNKEMETERGKLRDELSKVTPQSKLGEERKPRKKHKASDFRLGDDVYVISLGLNGIVTSLPNEKGDLFVQMGILSSKVNIKDVELIKEVSNKSAKSSQARTGKLKMSKVSTISPEINLIGKRVDQALVDLDKYLDDAYLSHLKEVRIIHGKGTGALRDAVHSHLKRSKYIKSYRLGAFGEGDAGVTIAEFK
ncbi:MAG: endonuclease MutS2 [Clostridiales bacterium]|nr:endonuclease MutS2 [Clostridiales bacterium]